MVSLSTWIETLGTLFGVPVGVGVAAGVAAGGGG
jgi:hypothetical protein